MELLSEEDLLEYVRYWGGDLNTLKNPDYRKGRGLAAVVFYCLHHPETLPSSMFWSRTIKQAVSFLWTHTRLAKVGATTVFRTKECENYCVQLVKGFVEQYGVKAVFQYRYQNWNVVNCELMLDQLWTIQEMMKENV